MEDFFEQFWDTTGIEVFNYERYEYEKKLNTERIKKISFVEEKVDPFNEVVVLFMKVIFSHMKEISSEEIEEIISSGIERDYDEFVERRVTGVYRSLEDNWDFYYHDEWAIGDWEGHENAYFNSDHSKVLSDILTLRYLKYHSSFRLKKLFIESRFKEVNDNE